MGQRLHVLRDDTARQRAAHGWQPPADYFDDVAPTRYVPRTDAELIADTSEDDACALRMAIEDAQTSLRHALAALDDRDLQAAEKSAAAALEDLSNALEA